MMASPRWSDRRHNHSYHSHFHLHHHQELPLPEDIHARPVSEKEFAGIPRTIRGRITRHFLNDALKDIERVCRNKYAVLAEGVKRREDQHLWNAHIDMEVEEHGGSPWVSEQCLRRSCVFFRSGESTARAVLAILGSLHRIHQLPGRNSEVTYIIASDQET